MIKMSFLSPYCEVMIFKIASALGIEKIRKSLLWSSDWMIEENMLHASLIIKDCGLSISKAEWYIDPDYSGISILDTPKCFMDAARNRLVNLWLKLLCIQGRCMFRRPWRMEWLGCHGEWVQRRSPLYLSS